MPYGKARFTVTYGKTNNVKRSTEEAVVDASNELFYNRFKVVAESCADPVNEK